MSPGMEVENSDMINGKKSAPPQDGFAQLEKLQMFHFVQQSDKLSPWDKPDKSQLNRIGAFGDNQQLLEKDEKVYSS